MHKIHPLQLKFMLVSFFEHVIRTADYHDRDRNVFDFIFVLLNNDFTGRSNSIVKSWRVVSVL